MEIIVVFLIFLGICLLCYLRSFLIDFYVEEEVKDFNFEEEKQAILSILENYGFNKRRCRKPYCNGVLFIQLNRDGEDYLKCSKCLWIRS